MLDTILNDDIFKDLPTMPEVVVKVLKLLENDTTPNMLLADAIAHDPAMSARIFTLINSPAYSTHSKPTKLDHAIGFIGRKMIKSIALECSFKAATPQAGAFGKLLWENAIGCAVGARMIAMETKLFDLEEAFIAGMLCPIGKSVLASKYGDRYQKLLKSSVSSKKDLSILEIEQFGFPNEVVAAVLLKKWNLDKVMVEAVLHFRDLKNQSSSVEEKNLSRILNIAAAFCEKSGIGQIVPNNDIDVTKILSAYLLHIQPEKMPQLHEQFISLYEKDRDYYLS